MNSRAAVFRDPEQPLQIESFPLPDLQPHEALVRVEFCTICGSDLHSMSGHRSVPTPSVLGHEMVGRVVAVSWKEPPTDLSGRALAAGDRVVWAVAASCGECDRCRSGLPQKCRSLFKYGHESFDCRSPLSGGLAEYCLLVPGTAVVTINESLNNEVICPVSCATATVAEALRGCGELRHRSVLIFGAGMLGLTAAAMARSCGAERIVVCDVDPQRLGSAAEFGATDSLLWSELADRGSGTMTLEADVVLEMSGAADAVSAGLSHLAVGGELVLVGSVSPTPSVAVDPEQLVRRLLRIRGVHNYSPASLQHAVQFLNETDGRFPFDKLVAKSFPLDQVNEAIAFAIENRACRVAIRPQE
ncbi:MAG: zinc-binding dehydrogenase [Planctomycetota bacterium]